MRRRPPTAALALLSAVLAVVAVWLLLHNPTIDGTSKGSHYPCLAAYDTVLNHADNVPGGESPPDGDVIGARCRHLGDVFFTAGVGTGAVALVLASALTLSVVRTRQSSPRL